MESLVSGKHSSIKVCGTGRADVDIVRLHGRGYDLVADETRH